ncbi:late expression factor 11 [Alphabaculovirus altersperidaniae]|uniref:Late expression factor 11 n=1 Tax=Spodoptera eridania nucleopolyhedrovirus TaxID=2315721 RepID=A0ABX6TQS3_9ABAC|nr:late expression factor 11 [Spodoptera eridania nucleopolyhedrovirus]QNV47840.1 late expression factor 11 [Spodoptera eridania nucleopolyhedrovirus]
MDKRTQQQQQQQRRRQYITSVRQRFEENYQCCLTRSEVYAIVREVINKRKHNNDVSNVWAHIFEPGFQEQVGYIRANIDKALITVGGEQPHCKRLSYHVKKLNKIFNLNKTLESEYKDAVDKYHQDNNNNNTNNADERSE